ncbi:hypothetical protein UPYG_G00235830 [Umbra pygmaea]|uniref:Uncharacterized protein n=1 Tax=Umbra pygmaea TaxID=75934 RepID=A0ABD0WEB0_UMBPY
MYFQSILEKNKRQAEELIRLRAQLALQSGPDLQQFDSQLRQDTDIQDNLVCGLSVKAGKDLKYTFSQDYSSKSNMEECCHLGFH